MTSTDADSTQSRTGEPANNALPLDALEEMFRQVIEEVVVLDKPLAKGSPVLIGDLQGAMAERPAKGKAIIRESLRDTLWIAGPGILLFLALRYVVPIKVVPSASMQPTIEVGDKVLVNRFDIPDRGDVIVFDSGFRNGLRNREPVLFLKRVVAVQGDRVEIASGQLVVNGVALDEPYTAPADDEFQSFSVPENHYFVLGDNRSASYDSRFIGAVAEEDVKGTVSFILTPGESFLASPNDAEPFSLLP